MAIKNVYQHVKEYFGKRGQKMSANERQRVHEQQEKVHLQYETIRSLARISW